MATHDYVIDNSTGANVRADINNALAAIVSNNSSSSQPTTRYAYMWWADTTNGVLKIRNSANDGWVELLQLDGTITLENGSASTPALANRSDLNTGVFFSAADKFNVATGGVERMELGTSTVFNEDGEDVDFRIEGDTDTNLFRLDASTDRIGIGVSTPQQKLHIAVSDSGSSNLVFTNATTGSTTNDGFIIGITGGEDAQLNMLETKSIKFSTADQLRMTLDSDGRLLIGHSSSLSIGSGDSLPLQVSSTNAPVFGGARFVNSSSGPFLSLAKSRAGSAGSNTIVHINDDLGTILFAGDDGTDLISKGASISAAVDGTPGSNDMPGRLLFSTTADGAASPSERLRIDKNGHMGLGVTPDDGWPSNGDFTAFQLGSGACVFGRGSGDEDRGGFAVNYYATGSGNKFLANGHANLVYLNDGNIDFYTSAQNTSGADADLSLIHVMNINPNKNVEIKDGDLIIGTAGHGIDFSAQTATSASGATTSSEVLDHYEEGTFTPFNPSLTASDLQGHYTRIGRVVHCSIYITIPSNSNGNDFVIDGLPFNTFNPDPSVGASLQGGYVIYSNYSAAVLVRTNQGGDRVLVNTIGGNNIQLTTLDNINFRIGLHYFTT
jgi:hypothetical protein